MSKSKWIQCIRMHFNIIPLFSCSRIGPLIKIFNLAFVFLNNKKQSHTLFSEQKHNNVKNTKFKDVVYFTPFLPKLKMALTSFTSAVSQLFCLFGSYINKIWLDLGRLCCLKILKSHKFSIIYGFVWRSVYLLIFKK